MKHKETVQVTLNTKYIQPTQHAFFLTTIPLPSNSSAPDYVVTCLRKHTWTCSMSVLCAIQVPFLGLYLVSGQKVHLL